MLAYRLKSTCEIGYVWLIVDSPNEEICFLLQFHDLSALPMDYVVSGPSPIDPLPTHDYSSFQDVEYEQPVSRIVFFFTNF